VSQAPTGNERGMSSAAQARQRPRSDGGGGSPAAATEPSDYGALNAAYLALLGATVAAARRRPAADTAIPSAELVPLGLATFALSKVVAREKIGTWMRERFVEEDADHNPRGPRGRGLRRAVGELVTCTRCVGAWAGLGLVGLRLLSPPAGRIATSVLATSAVNDFLQAAFRYTTERADAHSS
jgi:hypothetical protein